MSHLGATEWPSPSKLEDLREKGLIPYSSMANAMMAVLGLLFGLNAIRPKFSVIAEQLRLTNIETVSAAVFLQTCSALWGELLLILLVPLLCAAGMAFLTGLLQNKFFFSFGLVAFDLSRLWQPARLSPGALSSRLLLIVLEILLALSLSLWLIFANLRDLLSILNSTPSAASISEWSLKLFHDNLPMLAMFFTAGAFVAWLSVYLSFMFKHRMTRLEIEEEARS